LDFAVRERNLFLDQVGKRTMTVGKRTMTVGKRYYCWETYYYSVAKLEVVLVVLGTTKHFSKKIIFYCLKKNSPKILKMIHGTLASSIKCEILSNPVMLL
jgi:hypothetical protein